MNKFLKVVFLLLVLSSSVYLPSVNAASSTEMLITIAETNPVLLERLNTVAIDNAKLLNQVLKMANSKPEQLERLLDIAETDPEAFSQLVTINDAKEEISTMGIDDEDGIIRT
jgi:hypothetical protein